MEVLYGRRPIPELIRVDSHRNIGSRELRSPQLILEYH